MNNFYEELSKCRDSKPIALSLIPQSAQSELLQSRTIPTINDLFDKNYLDLTHPELLKVCKVELSKEQSKAVERDTISEAKGNNILKTDLAELASPRRKQRAKHILP